MSLQSEFGIIRGPLSPECVQMAQEELRETPERVREATQRLRELLHQDKTLHFGDDDESLLVFLRPCKFYPESALDMMKRIAEFRKTYADLVDGLMPEDEKEALTEGNVVNILKSRDHKGRRVLVVSAGAVWDTKKVTSNQMFRLFYLIHLAAILEPETQVRGVVVIMDFDGMTMAQAKALTPAFSMRLMKFIQEAMPIRLKEVHFVKEPWFFSVVWNLFKPFIKEKLKKRMYFHKSNMASVHKFLAPSHMPANYGGELPAIDYSGQQWYPVVQEYLDHYRAWNTYGYIKH